MTGPTKPTRVLLIEDNPGDVRLTQEAFQECRSRIHLDVAMDGEEAMRRLRGEGEFAGLPLPQLILLDLNLPRWNGKDVLKVIKTSERLRSIPVIILTTSTSEPDVQECYELYANCYLNKPVDFGQFFELIGHIETFWLNTAVLPTAKSR